MTQVSNYSALVIGIGNLYRGDDAVGLIVAQKLKMQLPANTVILEASGEGASLIESWQGDAAVIIVDAVQSGSKAGTIHRLDVSQQAVPSRFFHYSTHAFSVAEAIELARAMKQLPACLILYGIEGKSFQPGNRLSPEVKNASLEVIARICQELDAIREKSSPQV